MKNLKIGKKLLLGFGIVLVMLILASIVAFFGLRTMGTQVDNYSIYTVPNNNKVWQMRRDLISVQRYLLIALTENDQTKIDEALAISDTESVRINDTLTDYLTTSRVDKSQLDLLVDYGNQMTPLRKEIQDLLRKNNATDNATGFKIFTDEYKPILDKSAALLTDMGVYQDERAAQQAKDADNAFSSSMVLLAVVVALAVLITIIVTATVTKSIIIPVKQVQGAAQAISQGNLDVTVDYTSRDEMGVLAGNMRDTTATLKAIITDVDVLLEAMGQGDFTQKSGCAERYVGQYLSILSAMRDISSNLSNTMFQINQSSDQVSSGSDQVSSGAQALSQGATEQASSVEELAATINEISQQVKNNADNAVNASKKAALAGDEVAESNQKMQELIVAMNEISKSSQEIGKVIKTIEDIAFQTNILALNAAVEAARAGAAGKGFAVVADEVRNLASKSAEAAKGTTALIEGAIQAVANGTQLADDTAKSLDSVVIGTQEVTAIVDKISTATSEQATSIAQVTQGIDQISSVVQTNSATAEESAAASEELSGQAAMLKQLVGKFKLKDTPQSSSIEQLPLDEFHQTPLIYSSDKY